MQVHSPWRDEIGWVLALIGLVIIAVVIADRMTILELEDMLSAWMALLIGGVLLVAVGIGLHFESMPRRKAKAEAKTDQATPPSDAGSESAA